MFVVLRVTELKTNSERTPKPTQSKYTKIERYTVRTHFIFTKNAFNICQEHGRLFETEIV